MIPHDYIPESALTRALNLADRINWSLGGVFMWLSNICLLIMLGLTTATIVLRPFDISFYWMWPWTMVFFIWLSFFGFFALYARLKDVRVDFLANMLGPKGFAMTRILTDAATLLVTGVLIWQIPTVIETSRGVYDGAILPAGYELPRLALSIPLMISSVLIALSALLDLAKMAAGMPENVVNHLPEA
ncbi:TRAP transporter small permease [Oceaniglobus ichthyenteri]|uniref:TRAP transporter small permease n=1 Tax=Oceaniglobus ichthyenteri TaxID=2136177 RepID=UPI000D34429A|nr:TRAP transporter small permease subunit [Oceaniglobus ichthyenteri]